MANRGGKRGRTETDGASPLLAGVGGQVRDMGGGGPPSSFTTPNPKSKAVIGSPAPARRGLSATQPHGPLPVPVPQIGSYYGSEITSVDTDGDGVTDVLLVGAPMYFSEGRERGRVYVYSLRQVLRCAAGSLPGAPSPCLHSLIHEGN